jgi:catechol 2,3-dioxygenase-like lactoylglutathione lyase family enzyme
MTSIAPMLKQITHTQVYVLDQDEALDFYVGKLGMADRQRAGRSRA